MLIKFRDLLHEGFHLVTPQDRDVKTEDLSEHVPPEENLFNDQLEKSFHSVMQI